MPDAPNSPRIDYVDVDTARGVLEVRRQHIIKAIAMIEAEPAKLRQIRYSGLAADYNSIALTYYAVGYPLDAVVDNLRLAVRAYTEVFRLRGTEPPFEAYNVVPAPPETIALGGDPFVIRPMHDRDSKDYSLTNSRENYEVVCKALTAADVESAAHLAGMIWDPPDASYLGKRSVVCTLNDQRIAYAMKEYFAGNPVGVEAELKGLSSASASIRAQATMWRGLAGRDRDLFLNGLESLLRWHDKEAPLMKNRYEVELFMCSPGLGLARLALRDGVCQIGELPTGNRFLPVDILCSNQ